MIHLTMTSVPPLLLPTALRSTGARNLPLALRGTRGRLDILYPLQWLTEKSHSPKVAGFNPKHAPCTQAAAESDTQPYTKSASLDKSTETLY